MTTAMWAAVPFLALVAVDDFRNRRIRNRDVVVLAVFTGIVVLGLAIDRGSGVVLGAVVGAVLAAAPLGVAAIAQPARIGGGDVKLAAVIGALLGPESPWLSLAMIAGALVIASVVIISRRLNSVPLAPALVATGVAALLAAPSM